MRHFVISLVLFVGLSFQADQIFAASFNTYAHVNIVPSADALLNTAPGASTSQFALSGSAMEYVSVQITTLEVNSGTERTIFEHQSGFSFDLPNFDKGQDPSDRIITVVFE